MIEITLPAVQKLLETKVDPLKVSIPDGIGLKRWRTWPKRWHLHWPCSFTPPLTSGASIVPADWRTAHVTPVVKKGGKVQARILLTYLIVISTIMDHAQKHGPYAITVTDKMRTVSKTQGSQFRKKVAPYTRREIMLSHYVLSSSGLVSTSFCPTSWREQQSLFFFGGGGGGSSVTARCVSASVSCCGLSESWICLIWMLCRIGFIVGKPKVLWSICCCDKNWS